MTISKAPTIIIIYMSNGIMISANPYTSMEGERI